VKKAMVLKYRPRDVMDVSELKKHLNSATLKGNQDPSDLFDLLAAIEHAYCETAATLGIQDLSGAVFGAAPETYNTVFSVTYNINDKALGIDDLKRVMYNRWRQ
jgi:hypothetical protein